nr:hypothetical protein [Tanacetum cinerariifolium]
MIKSHIEITKAEKGVPLSAYQWDWLDDNNEEPDGQELEAHYLYMAKIQEVSTAESGPTFDADPLEKVHTNYAYNVFANDQEHIDQPKKMNDTSLFETLNTTLDSSDVCDNDFKDDHNVDNQDDEQKPTTTTEEAVPALTIIETYKNTPEKHAYFDAEAKAVHLILTGIRDDIYSTVDACTTTKEIWIAIELLQRGESLNKQDVKTNLFWEFGKFTSRDEESIKSYYSRIYKMMNEMVKNKLERTVTVAGAMETIRNQRVKDYAYHKEKMLLCKKVEKGVPLSAYQGDWLDDIDEETDKQELEAHYLYMEKIQEEHTDQPKNMNDTSLVETLDSNTILDSSDVCDNDFEDDHNVDNQDDEQKSATTTEEAVPALTIIETYKNTTKKHAYFDVDAKAIHLILIGIGDDIYSTVDACTTAKERSIELLQHGESLNKQDVKTNLFWEFGKFTSRDGESIKSYYSRIYKMMNKW